MNELKNNAWTYAEGERRRAWLRLSYRERLDWLWNAKCFAQRALGAATARAQGQVPTEEPRGVRPYFPRGR